MPKIIKKPKETILKIAKFHLMDQGIETLNMRAIAKDAEISVGTLYNYFPNKDYIVIALMTGFWEDFLKATDDLSESQEDGWKTLRQMYILLSDTLQVFRLEWLSGQGFQSDEAKVEGRRLHLAYRKRVMFAIERQFEKLKINQTDFDLEELSQFVFSNWLGMLSHSGLDYEVFERLIKKMIEE